MGEVRNLASMTDRQQMVWRWHGRFMTICFASFCTYECFTALAFFVRLRRTPSRRSKGNWIVFGYMCTCLVGFFIFSILESFRYRTKVFQELCVFFLWMFTLSFSYIFYDLLYSEESPMQLEPPLTMEDEEDKNVELSV